jgi:predicted secreted protein
MRKVRMLLLVGAVAVAGTLSACTFFPLVIDQTANGSLEATSVGGNLVIKLAGNPSVGYEWLRVAPGSLDDSPLEIVQEGRFKGGDGNICGAPGTFVFEYHAARAGTVTLRFEYRLAWETTAVDTFTVVIWVR